MAIRPPPMFGMKSRGPRPSAGGPAPLKVEHRIGAQVPPEILWELLRDVDGWSAWNPLYPRSRGEIRIGAPLELTEALPGRTTREARPVVLDWVPLEQIHWRDSRSDGWVKSVRYIEVDIVSATGCIVSNGEVFTGLLAKRHLKANRTAHLDGFRAMNQALIDHAGRLWADRGGAPANAP